MHQNSHHLAMALDIIHLALSADGYQDLKRIWMILKTKLGVAGLLLAAGQLSSDQAVLKKQRCFGLPPGWLERYIANNYYTVDPILRYALWLKKPFHWQQAFQHYDCTLLDSLPELKRASGHNGFAYGCRIGPEGYVIAITSIRLKNKQATEDQRRIICHIMPHLNAMLMRPGFMVVPKLSLQETLVIKWAGEGKSSWETAVILQTSERAVKYHLANVYRKLQVSKKPQAVIQAYKMGLLV